MRRTIAWALLSVTAAPTIVGETSGATTESVRALVQEARVQARQGRHRQAADILDRALTVAPNSEEVLRDYAQNSLAARDPVGAMNALEPLTRMHPTVAEYPYLLGVAQLQVGAMELSVESLQRSLRLEPDRALTLIALGITLNSQKRFSEAKEVLARSLDVEPEEVEALAALAEAEEGLGELEQAEAHAKRALGLAGSHSGAYFVLGKVRMSQDRFAEARDYFQQTIALSPDSAKAHYQLSLAYARLDDLESSQKHRELYQEAKEREEQHIVEMRTRAGLGVGGMKL